MMEIILFLSRKYQRRRQLKSVLTIGYICLAGIVLSGSSMGATPREQEGHKVFTMTASLRQLGQSVSEEVNWIKEMDLTSPEARNEASSQFLELTYSLKRTPWDSEAFQTEDIFNTGGAVHNITTALYWSQSTIASLISLYHMQGIPGQLESQIRLLGEQAELSMAFAEKVSNNLPPEAPVDEPEEDPEDYPAEADTVGWKSPPPSSDPMEPRKNCDESERD
jgi:hypothetical protein